MNSQDIIDKISIGVIVIAIYVGLANSCTLLDGYISTCEAIHQTLYGPVQPIPSQSPYANYNITYMAQSGATGTASQTPSPSPSFENNNFI